ncbi:MAG: crosslink repair DNA glycosylase YcaQ family protein [Pseudomonadota bacterium]
MSRPQLDQSTARALFLDRHGLIAPPSGSGKGDDLQSVIDRLGFVQVDSINTVARAHHMILHARRTAYRAPHLARLHDKERGVFEHWTHDASMIAMAFYPYWNLKFRRDAVKLDRQWRLHRRDGFHEKLDAVLRRIADHGPCSSAEVGEDEARGSGGWWDWHPSKTALEFLWRTGKLSVTKRTGFRKIYDLTENVIPSQLRARVPDDDETIDWACRAALDRLGFATSGELAAFWDLITPAEAQRWCAEAKAAGTIVDVDVPQADGSHRVSFAYPAALEETPPAPTNRLRILSPFDPAIRDRKRLERLFGYHYRIEVFVPEAKRQYGYYVFPVLEGDRMIGRIDMKADKTCLNVRAFWPEKGIRLGKARLARIETALTRTARLAGVPDISFAPDWQRLTAS